MKPSLFSSLTGGFQERPRQSSEEENAEYGVVTRLPGSVDFLIAKVNEQIASSTQKATTSYIYAPPKHSTNVSEQLASASTRHANVTYTYETPKTTTDFNNDQLASNNTQPANVNYVQDAPKAEAVSGTYAYPQAYLTASNVPGAAATYESPSGNQSFNDSPEGTFSEQVNMASAPENISDNADEPDVDAILAGIYKLHDDGGEL